MASAASKRNTSLPPSIALYYGIVQVESGRKEIAQDALKRAEAGNLLPEDRAIVQLAESKM